MKSISIRFRPCLIAGWVFVLAGILVPGAFGLDQVKLDSNATVGPLLVTADGVGTHTTSPGVPVTLPGVSSLDADGVADLIISRSDGTFRCTGTLLAGGTSLLTAGHCVTTTGTGTLNVNSLTATWQLSSGNVTATATAANVTVLTGWNGNPLNGNDLAVVTFASPVSTNVPRYDINRRTSEGGPGVPMITVGYGTTGIGGTGATLGSGTKRAGLNSADATLSGTLTANSVLLSDFDNGLSANDALPTIGGPASLGFGANEVGTAPGDSGGPTFFEANDSKLTLSAGAALGSFLVGAVPAQSVTLTKTGTNSTRFDATYTGNHNNSNIANATISDASDVSDHKIAGVTSAGARNGSPPDIDGALNSSFGEFELSTRVSSFQSFLSPFLGAGFTPLASQVLPVNIDDTTAGAKSATVTVDNLAGTFEFAGTGSLDTNDSATFTATVLDHSQASFSNPTDVNTLLINFGAVPQFSSPAGQSFSLYNLEQLAGFTAGLDLDSITPAGNFSMFNTTLAPFANLSAGSFQVYLATIVTTTPGFFTATYTIGVSDQNLPGALAGTSLVLTLTGQVFAPVAIEIPEPSTLLLVTVGLCGVAVRRRRFGRR